MSALRECFDSLVQDLADDFFRYPLAQQSGYAGGNFHVRKPNNRAMLLDGQSNDIGRQVLLWENRISLHCCTLRRPADTVTGTSCLVLKA